MLVSILPAFSLESDIQSENQESHTQESPGSQNIPYHIKRDQLWSFSIMSARHKSEFHHQWNKKSENSYEDYYE